MEIHVVVGLLRTAFALTGAGAVESNPCDPNAALMLSGQQLSGKKGNEQSEFFINFQTGIERRK